MKTAELTGAALDWAVAKCEGMFAEPWLWGDKQEVLMHYKFSTNWSQAGPIIEREKLCAGYRHQADPERCEVNAPATNCWARTTSGGYLSYGPTPLIAAMRCYVASKLGGNVEIPEGLAP